MGRWQQFWRTLRQPAYRTRLAFFLILGVAAVLLAILLQPRSPFWSGVLLEFAVAFGAVGVLQLLWDFLGGDPIELRIGEVKDEVRSVQRSITVLSDLVDGRIGIQRIWPDRRTWQADPVDGLTVWQDRVCHAEHVDILSNTFWSNWMDQDQFRQRLFCNVARGASVRILLYHPDSEVLRLRAEDEEDVFLMIQDEKIYEMQQEINSALSRIAEGWRNLPVSFRTNLEVHLTTQTLHPVQLIRADNLMLVCMYLSGKSGSSSPTMQIQGPGSAYWVKYEKQFEILWRRGNFASISSGWS